MATNWLNVDLSSDEDDDDFDPTKEVDEEAPKPKKKKLVRGRGTAGLARIHADEVEEEEDEDEDDPLDGRPRTQKERERREKMASVWESLKAPGSEPGPSGRDAPGQPSAQVGQKRSRDTFAEINALCRPVKPASGEVDKTSFLRHMKIFAPQNQGSAAAAPANAAAAAPSTSAPAAAAAPTASAAAPAGKPADDGVAAEERRKAAAQALALAKSAMSLRGARDVGKVQITETRRFAGQNIQVTRMVEEDSKEVKKIEQQKSLAKSGLDKLLSGYEQKKKVSVLDKTRMDWDSFKKTKKDVEEELEEYKKSDKRYLEKVDFLKRAELREYEKERDARLASDVRTRGRL